MCAALLGLPQALSGWMHIGLLLVVVAGLGWMAWRSRAGGRWPGRDAVDRRLERGAGLTHRPLAVLTDRPAGGGDELWRPHQARALSQVARLRRVWPQPAMPARDPRALRLLLLLGLTIGAAIAGPDLTDRLLRAVTPHFPLAPAIPALEIRAWAAPPAFTGLPPMLLPDSGGAVTIPAGSRVTVGLSGGRGGAPSLTGAGADEAGRAFDVIGPDSFQVQAEPAADGSLAVRRDGVEVARWEVTLRPDLAPVVIWTRPPATLRGVPPRVRLMWKATHDYGVTAMAAEFRLRDRPAALPLTVAIPLTSRPRDAAGTTSADLSAHPWAGLPVTATLVARDGAGLAGHSDAVPFVLPARRFRHPGALAIVAVRQKLALAPQDGSAASTALRDAAGRAALWSEGDTAPDTLRTVAATLDGTPSDAAVDGAQATLWELALRLEEGTTQRTAEALRKAQQELRASLDPKASPDARDKAEIDRRARALERAMQRQQEALRDQAARDPRSATPTSPQDRAAAEQKLQQLRDAAQADKMDDARDRMAELDEMLDQMRKAGRSQAQKQRDEGRQKGRQQMGVLQDLVRRQAGQIDHAEARLAEPSASDQAGARGQDRAVQMALRRVLGELMQRHGDLTGSVPKNLGDADAAMREAAGALADSRDDTASAAALRAVEALQEGGQQMSRQLSKKFGSSQNQSGEDGQQAQGEGDESGEDGQQAMGEGQEGGEPGDGSGQSGTGEQAEAEGQDGSSGPDGRPLARHRDPFGRATREGLMGADGGRDTRVPEEMERARGRAVQDELRRREAQRTRPQQELDYIGRLLKQE